MPRPVITLTTDFGLTDAYVAAMKGVILSISPDAEIVDVSHQVEPQNVFQAGYLLQTVVPYFPTGTVHLVVVDPGVGTDRRPIAIDAGVARFVAPDNGVLTAPLSSLNVLDPATGHLTDGTVGAEIRNPRFISALVSATFHGRDVFAPAAAHLVCGVRVTELGPTVVRMEILRMWQAQQRDGVIEGRVIHVDRFGNLITNIPGSAVPHNVDVRVADRTIAGLSRNYQEREVAALVGSNGYVEIAARNGSAATVLGLGPGAVVTMRARA